MSEPVDPTGSRPTLRSARVIAIVAFCVLGTIAFFVVRGALSEGWSRPGSPELYLTGVLGSALVLIPYVFYLTKRSGMSASPPTWFVAHVVAACAGTALLVVHSALHLDRAPALLLLALLFLVAQGTWARTRLPREVADTFGTKHRAFRAANAYEREQLQRLIAAKRALLERLSPGSDEGLFSPTPRHWLRHPFDALAYQRLANAEASIVGARASVSRAQAYWRRLHVAIAVGVLAGLVVHVITVTFFAGYVAEGGEIHWWHLRAWGG